jgi:hypothetical protein
VFFLNLLNFIENTFKTRPLPVRRRTVVVDHRDVLISFLGRATMASRTGFGIGWFLDIQNYRKRSGVGLLSGITVLQNAAGTEPIGNSLLAIVTSK